MNLKEFVSGSLTQIAEGIAEAQGKAEGRYRISPRHIPNAPEKNASVHIEHTGDSLECVEFDIAVSTKSNIDGEGSMDFVVVDSSVQASLEKLHASRIKFQVYVAWPRQQGR